MATLLKSSSSLILVQVTSAVDARAVGHHVLSRFSRRHFLSANLEEKISADVKRFVEVEIKQ